MKLRAKLFVIIIFVVLVFINVSAQDKRADTVKSTLIKLIEYCVNNDYKSAARYLIYNGDDSSRIYRATYDYSIDKDTNYVIEECKNIKDLTENGGEFIFKDFSIKQRGPLESYIWQVNFEKGEKKVVYFNFLKINEKYALFEIN